MTGSLQVKNDKYYAVLNFRDNDGKRVQKWIPLNLPLRGNKRKAETMLRQLIEQYQGLEAIEPINRLLGQHIADWVEHNRPKLAVTTYNQYVNILNLHLIPYFNPRGITLGSVTPRRPGGLLSVQNRWRAESQYRDQAPCDYPQCPAVGAETSVHPLQPRRSGNPAHKGQVHP